MSSAMKSFDSCTQPDCFLREDGVDSQSLAKLIVRVLAGEDVQIESPIENRDRCVECTLRVLYGGQPLPTREEVERSLELGRWSYRRSKRIQMRDSHHN